ncbi:MAG: hypothetical protein KYX68_13900 [Flavobacterium sp.]|nr:hypothetical protein [Flavobacterium sp.]
MRKINSKEDYNELISIDLLVEIIKKSYNLFCLKYAKGSVKASNEYEFQFEFGIILKQLGSLHEFSSEDKFEINFEQNFKSSDCFLDKSNTKKARVDIVIKYYQKDLPTAKGAIELKFLKKINKKESVSRYDVFTDISNLEKYKKEGIDTCFLLLITDNEHYVSQQKYSKYTSDFDFRHGQTYYSKTLLTYKTPKSTKKSIQLNNDYSFSWTKFNDLYFLILEV